MGFFKLAKRRGSIMEFYYSNPKFYNMDNRVDFEKDIENQILDLIGPDRWYNGEPYTPIIDKLYTMDLYNDDGDTVEILVKVKNNVHRLQLWLSGWRVA